MRVFLTLIFVGSAMLIFQNCGESARTVGLFADEIDQSSTSTQCQTSNCTNPGQLLWLSIREYEPYKLNYDDVIRLGYFTVGGQCGIGFFPNHYFEWTLREGFGGQNVIASGTSDNLCDLGQFQLPIEFNGAQPPQANQRYQLTVDLIGVNENFQQFTNPMPANNGSVDILVISE